MVCNFALHYTADETDRDKADETDKDKAAEKPKPFKQDNQEVVVKVTRPQGRSVSYEHWCFSFNHTYKIYYFDSSVYDFQQFMSRYKKREKGKTVRGYSSKELEGILVSIVWI